MVLPRVSVVLERLRSWSGRAAGAASDLPGFVIGTPAGAYTVVLLALAALVATTTMVAGRYFAEREAMARHHYESGLALARTGERPEAIAHFREALSLQRDDGRTQLALATTLLDEGRPREASTYLSDLLRTDPTNGLANLTRARVARVLDEETEAELYYQRAIYGTWAADAQARRLDTRFELAEMLLANGRRARVLGELEQIKADAPADLDVARRVGRLFQQAGAPERAADEFRLVVAERSNDGDAWAWLCQVRFTLGEYADAMTAGERALAIRPDPGTVDRVDAAREVIALNPAARRLSSRERERRGRALLERVLATLDRCLDPAEGAASASLEQQREAARALLARRPQRSVDAAEEVLTLSEDLWQATVGICPAARADDRVVTLLMTRLLSQGGTP